MNLDQNQKQKVATWLQQGLKLSEVQRKLQEEFNLRLTYMEVKFLVSDLDLKPKDPEPEKPAEPAGQQAEKGAGPGEDDVEDDDGLADDDQPAPGAGGVKVTMDQIARPGAMVSGKVTFANGKMCEWILDQMGRLGVVPAPDGYKPSPADLQEFQLALEGELRKSGF
ncbi:MAG TPA: hypothetical protein DCY13_07775 [Verrucomicrobiales bacterium]|nr:hypothetical protein [Verrucomicrobiales bacterium]